MKANGTNDLWTDGLAAAMRHFRILTLRVVLVLGVVVAGAVALRPERPKADYVGTRNRSVEFLSLQVNRFLSTGVHEMMAQRKADRLEWEELVRRLKTRDDS